jgi:hypothetical protein
VQIHRGTNMYYYHNIKFKIYDVFETFLCAIYVKLAAYAAACREVVLQATGNAAGKKARNTSSINVIRSIFLLF